MKYIIAVINPEKLDDLLQALSLIGVIAKTASNVSGVGRQKGHAKVYRGNEYHSDMLSKVKIEIAVPDDLADNTVEKICEAVHTNSAGDGKVFMLDLCSATRIRTGETGETALGQMS